MEDKTMEEVHETKRKAAPMKFSFTKSKPSLSRPPLFPKENPKPQVVEYVTEFDGKGMNVAETEIKVIPKQENSWRPEKRMKNITMECDSRELNEDRFVIDTLCAGPNPDLQYGLTVSSKKLETPNEVELGTRAPSLAQLEEQKLREDLQVLPDEASLDAYDTMPVEEFGEALLRGMGWEKGKPIGRNSKMAVSPVQYVKRVRREGLGAVPAPRSEKSSRHSRPGETRVSKTAVVAHIQSDTRPSREGIALANLDEGTGNGITVGKKMAIVGGPYAGFRGEVTDKRKSDGRSSERVYLRLLENGEEVRVRSDEVAEIGSLQEEVARKRIAELKIDDDEKSRRGHKYDFKRDRSENKDEMRDGVADGEKRDGRSRTLGRGEGRERDFDGSERPSLDRRREHIYDKARDHTTVERNSKKRGNEKQENLAVNSNSREAEWDAERSQKWQSGKLDDTYGRREEDRKKETHRKEAVTSFKREDSCKEFKSEEKSEREPVKGEVRSGLRTLSENKGRYYFNSHRSWLRTHIRVRIISKTLQKGTLYLKKAHVVDVSSPDVCDIVLDDNGALIQGVTQEQLETALPRRGGRLIVVGGEHRGVIGKLLERDSEKEVALVQTEEDFEVLSLNLDDVAEFIGDSI